MSHINLNLARKWRSKQFDEIIGQNLAIRLIKNSLFRNLIFPVYLFSGTRGCGKTSMARIFAASLNCKQLESFQQNPQSTKIPCTECYSCNAMLNLQHTDFIEIDAASHTGVDNIRQIIDTSSFMPTLGKRKIYLIDEAHMLSKAAFNALLKILEEPPVNVVFMLATTDPHKIIDTVKSRCFQLFFHPINPNDLVPHLEYICTQEDINFTKEALEIIAQESEGSVRDALNIIERARLIDNNLDKNIVLELLGFLDDEQLFQLFKAIIEQNHNSILEFCTKIELQKLNAHIIWKKVIDIIRVALYIKVGTKNIINNYSEKNIQFIISTINNCPTEKLIKMLEICYSYELIFLKSAVPYNVLEIVLLKISKEEKNSSSNGTLKPNNLANLKKENVVPKVSIPANKQEANNNNIQNNTNGDSNNNKENKPQFNSAWDKFTLQIDSINDPLVISIFKQANFKSLDSAINKIYLTFSKDLVFFKDWIDSTKNLWFPLLKQEFGSDVTIDIQFDDSSAINIPLNAPIAPPVPVHIPTGNTNTSSVSNKQSYNNTSTSYSGSNNYKYQARNNRVNVEKEISIDVSDREKWQKANILLKIFPGIISSKAGSP